MTQNMPALHLWQACQVMRYAHPANGHAAWAWNRQIACLPPWVGTDLSLLSYACLGDLPRCCYCYLPAPVLYLPSPNLAIYYTQVTIAAAGENKCPTVTWEDSLGGPATLWSAMGPHWAWEEPSWRGLPAGGGTCACNFLYLPAFCLPLQPSSSAGEEAFLPMH